MRIAVATAAIATSVAGLASIVLVALFPTHHRRRLPGGRTSPPGLQSGYASGRTVRLDRHARSTGRRGLAPSLADRSAALDPQRAQRSRARCDRNVGVVAADRACLASAQKTRHGTSRESHLVAFTCRAGTGPRPKRPRPGSPDASLSAGVSWEPGAGASARIDRHQGPSALPLVVGKGALWR